MIGQTTILNKFQRLIDENSLPQFVIIEGEVGSGKKCIIKEISKMLKSKGIEVVYSDDNSVQSVREMIQNAYTVKDKCYVFLDIDGMSLAGKNALLKVTEEPPTRCYFIMTVEDMNNILSTLKSRATTFEMGRYSVNELTAYIKDIRPNISEEEKDILTSICSTPGEINEVLSAGTQDFIDYVNLVIDNIVDVSEANAFKVPSKVSLKTDAEGYDLRLFWKVFNHECIKRSIKNLVAKEKDAMENVNRYVDWVHITSKYLKQLSVKGINKTMLIDNWILDIREAADEC